MHGRAHLLPHLSAIFPWARCFLKEWIQVVPSCECSLTSAKYSELDTDGAILLHFIEEKLHLICLYPCHWWFLECEKYFGPFPWLRVGTDRDAGSAWGWCGCPGCPWVLAKPAALLVHLGIPWEFLQQETKDTIFTYSCKASGGHTGKAVLLLCNFRHAALQGYCLLGNTLFVQFSCLLDSNPSKKDGSSSGLAFPRGLLWMWKCISDSLSIVRANFIQMLALLPCSGLQLFQWMLFFIIVLDYRVLVLRLQMLLSCISFQRLSLLAVYIAQPILFYAFYM